MAAVPPSGPYRRQLATADLEIEDDDIVDADVTLVDARPPVIESAPVVAVAPVVVAPDPFAVVLAATASGAPPRASLPDLIDLLFDAMADLSLFETAVEGASYCLTTALRAVPSRIGLVHLYDIDAREFVVVYAQGTNADRLLMTRTPETDTLISSAMHRHDAIAVGYEPGGARLSERHALFGDVRAVLVAPVVLDGRYLGAIELLDPVDGGMFERRGQNGVLYVADRYAEFLSERGIVMGNVVAPPSAILAMSIDEARPTTEAPVTDPTPPPSLPPVTPIPPTQPSIAPPVVVAAAPTLPPTAVLVPLSWP